MIDVLLCDYAHARAGDKGNTLSVAVFAFAAEHYAWLARELTCERVAGCLSHRAIGTVKRYELPNLGGLDISPIFAFITINLIDRFVIGALAASTGLPPMLSPFL